MSFVYKIIIMPAIAILTFIVIMIFGVSSGAKNENLLMQIEAGFFPAFELSRDLREALTEMQRKLQDAAASSDEDHANEADALKNYALKRIQESRGNATLTSEELDNLEKSFINYSTLAKETTIRMIRGETGENILQNVKKMSNEYNVVRENLDSATASQKKKMMDAFFSARKAAGNTGYVIAASVVVCLLLLIVVSIIVIISVSRPIRRTIGMLTQSTEQTAAFSNQLTNTSQQMASSANEQASSLEEVTSSLEEISSIIRQNADNINQANNVAKDTSIAAENSIETLTRMSTAISKIKDSSDQTAKIIKTIDEIAFQTNLLALNAAVEAARAGESGKGFAVVAEEVRNLVQRSTAAARETTDLIEEAQKNAEGGVSVTGDVKETISQIIDNVKNVSNIISEVTVASDEQAAGIEQVNTSIAKMDRTTQTTAANAEEFSSSSEELDAQVNQLIEIVDLLMIVIGKNSRNFNDNSFSRRSESFHPGILRKHNIGKGKKENVPLLGRE